MSWLDRDQDSVIWSLSFVRSHWEHYKSEVLSSSESQLDLRKVLRPRGSRVSLHRHTYGGDGSGGFMLSQELHVAFVNIRLIFLAKTGFYMQIY